MGALYVVREDKAKADPGLLSGVRAQFARHGFTAPTSFAVPGWTILHAPFAFGGPDCAFAQGDDFALVAGTLSYAGKMGQAALPALLAELDPEAPDWSKLAGQFALLVHKRGRTVLFTDYFACFQLFTDADRTIFSTSLLGLLHALPAVRFDPQGVYEYALNISPTGDDTLFREVRKIGPDALIELTPAGSVTRALAKPLPEATTDEDLDARLSLHKERLLGIVGTYVETLGNHVNTPLSGGLDSRLLLAALRTLGCRPHVYVYGSKDSPDVQVARDIGRSQGFDVAWIEKGAYRAIQPDDFAEQVARNFHETDGVPNYGGIFDNGGNEAARKAVHAGGALAASGGCGEVYRDFFFLADRALPARTVARSFFARYDRRDLTDAFNEPAFLGAIERKILAALGRPGDRGPIPRVVLEQVYPRVRCRAFFGNEISLVAREGAYLMPFIDHNLVKATMTLPVAMKQAGRFEAALLNAIDPVLAREPSAYGHDFTVPPSFRHRFSEWSTRARPAWVRQRSYEWQRRFRPMKDEHGGLLGPEYLGRVLDTELPAMRPYFHVDRVADPGIRQRLACLQYLAEQLGSKLRQDGAPALNESEQPERPERLAA